MRTTSGTASGAGTHLLTLPRTSGYVFWKPGEYEVNRNRLTPKEWKDWGHRQVWEIASVRSNNIHPAMFPLQLALRVIRLYTDENDIVLDPFAGSFTTVAVANKLGRYGVGIELNPEYYKIGLRRLGILQEFKGENLLKVKQRKTHNKSKSSHLLCNQGVLPLCENL